MEKTTTNWPHAYGDLLCSICRKQIKSLDCELLEGTVLEVLEVVIINLNLTTIQPVICKDCNKKLLDAFQHKSMWIYTEDRLFPYVNSASDGKVDIKTVYLNENDLKLFDIETDTQICRLCLELINDKSWNMLFEVLEKQYSVEMFEKYVPELNLSATENPIVCKRCLDSLRVFMSFITLYQDQAKTEDYFEVKEELKPGGINSVTIENMEQNNIEFNSRYEAEILKCPKCPHVSKNKTRLLKHGLIHKTKKQAKLFNCKICSYRSGRKDNVKKHLLTHQTKNLKCKTCEFKTNYKNYLKIHEMRHKNSSEGKIFKCELCSFKTIYKGSIRSHVLVHKLLSEVEVFKCEICTFKTKHKRSLQIHTLIHKPHSEVEVFKCKFCFYKTMFKGSLKTHILIHKPLSEVDWFKCELCPFKTKYKASLVRHNLIQKSRPLLTIALQVIQKLSNKI